MRAGITILNGRALVGRKISPQGPWNRVDQSQRGRGKIPLLSLHCFCSIFGLVFRFQVLKGNPYVPRKMNKKWEMTFCQCQGFASVLTSADPIISFFSFIKLSQSTSYVPCSYTHTHNIYILYRHICIFQRVLEKTIIYQSKR